MILLIDTSNIEYFFIGLADKQILIYRQQITAHFEQEEKLLIHLDEMFNKYKCAPSSLTGIIVVNGPGSFSALRIGLAVVNTLGWQLDIPVVGIQKNTFQSYEELYQVGLADLQAKKGFTLVLPIYDKEPNINLKKK
jgi:tRNA threonylcarbamoyladenosine biosynthesis protein TsaB